ncbi:hypothetical protein RHGRI_034601 [Rhododendron griersonianum]|uniref:HIT domain-containing protein n=1 Tax=Rhododendron griersonianum TaxID=479676 RepID=A0AAV6I184_9ERIC|nr:hypothetical protein RHGRI_034601 [Rhododendron griersonianum]
MVPPRWSMLLVIFAMYRVMPATAPALASMSSKSELSFIVTAYGVPPVTPHYLVIPTEHIPTVKDLQRRTEDFSLVSHMFNVGQTLLQRDAPQSQYRFGFHQPPLNSVDHLHLHCLALPFIPRWKHVKYRSLGPLGGFIEAEKLLERIKPVSSIPSEV